MTFRQISNAIRFAVKKGLYGDAGLEFLKTKGIKPWQVNKLFKAGQNRFIKYNRMMPWKISRMRTSFTDVFEKAVYAQRLYTANFRKMDLERVEEWRDEELRRFEKMLNLREEELVPLIEYAMSTLGNMPLKRLAGAVMLIESGTMASPLKEHIDSGFIREAGAGDLLSYIGQFYSVKSNQYRHLANLMKGGRS